MTRESNTVEINLDSEMEAQSSVIGWLIQYVNPCSVI